MPLVHRIWHESLTPAQEAVCRWVWETCAQHYEPWEQFEVGFLYDFNISHELAVWVRIALVFVEFVKRHPSVALLHRAARAQVCPAVLADQATQ